MNSIKSASIMAAVRSIFLRLTPEVIDHVVSKVDIEIRSAYCQGRIQDFGKGGGPGNC